MWLTYFCDCFTSDELSLWPMVRVFDLRVEGLRFNPWPDHGDRTLRQGTSDTHASPPKSAVVS